VLRTAVLNTKRNTGLINSVGRMLQQCYVPSINDQRRFTDDACFADARVFAPAGTLEALSRAKLPAAAMTIHAPCSNRSAPRWKTWRRRCW
jgi:hypothetical protein